MIGERCIRELLIASCHSSLKAQRFFESQLDSAELLDCLMRIAVDADDYGGDAPMQAARYISQFSPNLIEKHEEDLIAALPHIMVTAARLPSHCARLSA